MVKVYSELILNLETFCYYNCWIRDFKLNDIYLCSFLLTAYMLFCVTVDLPAGEYRK